MVSHRTFAGQNCGFHTSAVYIAPYHKCTCNVVLPIMSDQCQLMTDRLLVCSDICQTKPKFFIIHTAHNLLNFQETFLVDKLSKGANPESSHCVVRTLALIKKRRRKKKKMNNFLNLPSIIIYHAKRIESKFSWVVSCMAIVELQFGVGCGSFCPFFDKHFPYHLYNVNPYIDYDL